MEHADTDPQPTDHITIDERLSSLEERVAALEGPTSPRDPASPPRAPDLDEQFWVLNELPRHGEFPDGSVIFAGDVSFGGKQAAYQWHRPTQFLIDESWDDNLERLGALAHPVRGALLRRLLAAPATVTELVAEEVVTSTGTGYHHLGALQAGGWVAKGPGGRFSVRTARVVPLLTIIAATEDH